MKTSKPLNQKDVYNAFGDLYQKIMNNEVTPENAENAMKALCGMNQTYMAEIKRNEFVMKLKELGDKGNKIKLPLFGNPYEAIDQINSEYEHN
jgi:hypothetical protein